MSVLPHTELTQLLALFNARRYADMERQAQTLLAQYPTSGEAWKALSVAQQIQGKDAIVSLREAMTLLPRDADLPSNLGALLSDRQQFEEAARCFQQALTLKPDFAEAHSNLALSLLRLHRFDEAAVSCRRALALKPAFAEAQNNLGVALNALGKFDDAAFSFRHALALRPDLAEAHTGLGAALSAAGDLETAIGHYRRAALLRPSHAETHSKLGNALIETGQHEAARESLLRVVALRPNDAHAHASMGVALYGLGLFDEAEVSYRRALHIDPRLVVAHNNLGNTVKALGRPEEALSSFLFALSLDPGFAMGHRNLGATFREQGRFQEAAASYRRALDIDAFDFGARSDLLFVYNYLSEVPVAERLAEASRFDELATKRARPFTTWPDLSPKDGRRLRVGFVSADLRGHPVGYFAQSVLAALATEFEVIVYASHADDGTDPVSNAIRSCVHDWRPVLQLNDEQLSSRIREDCVDVLIDLSGHTAGNRLPAFAWRPAPVQLSWLGYCATTGMSAIDCFIADPWIAPPAVTEQFTEIIWRLPHTFLNFTPPNAELSVGALPALRNGHITFGCFNKLAKMNQTVVALWARVLRSVPGSRLMLKAPQLNFAAVQRSVIERFAGEDIGAERLLLEGASPRVDYLRAFDRVDMALDPFPYPGGTTSMDGLWMGVPMLSLRGEPALSRQGESILQNIGLPQWVAADADDFVARAARHAGDLQTLANLRAGLRERLMMSPLCDTSGFAADFAAALYALHRERSAHKVC